MAEKNTIPELYAFIADEPQGEGGICAADLGGTLMPLVTGNPANLDAMRGFAQQIADASGLQVKLVRYTVREDLEVIAPQTPH